MSQAEREQLAEKYAARAVALLRQAVDAGFKDVAHMAHMKQNRGLDPLRQREDFKNLLSDLEEKAKQ